MRADYYNDFLAPLLMSAINPARTVLKASERRKSDYSSGIDHGQEHIETPLGATERQITAFNTMWGRIQHEDPFYSWWKNEHDLPTSISSIKELAAFPLLTRDVLTRKRDLVFEGRDSAPVVATGGSTSTPLRLPTSASDISRAAHLNRATRAWYGVNRFDRYVHIWGHAHHFGSGFKKSAQYFLRASKDLVGNALRISVYATDEESTIRQLRQIQRIQPEYIVGFSSAVARLAATALRYSIKLDLPKLRVVFLTADNASIEDIKVIENAFGAPVAIEYGAIETGIIAHSKIDTYPLEVMSRNVILTADPRGEAAITTLQRNSFPLINYQIGDRIEGELVVDGSILSIASLDGRNHERLRLLDSTGESIEFDARLAYQALKGNSSITSIQFRELALGIHAVIVTTGDPLSIKKQLIGDLVAALGHIDTTSVYLEIVDKPVQSLAGKVPLVIRDIKN